MAVPSISTSPVEKLRWKFVMSSWASHRQNSTKLNSVTSLCASEVLVSVTRWTSAFSPRGTTSVTSARMPPRSPVMVV